MLFCPYVAENRGLGLGALEAPPMMIRILATSATIAATLVASNADALETERPAKDRTPAIQWVAETVIVLETAPKTVPTCIARPLVQGSGTVKVCE